MRSRNRSSSRSAGLGLLHPWADRTVATHGHANPPGKPALDRNWSAHPVTGHHLAMNRGEPPGLLLDTPVGGKKKKMSTYFPSAGSQRDHPLHPSKRHTASAFPCFSCRVTMTAAHPGNHRLRWGCASATSAPGTHHGSAQPELLPPPGLAEVMPPQKGHHGMPSTPHVTPPSSLRSFTGLQSAQHRLPRL